MRVFVVVVILQKQCIWNMSCCQWAILMLCSWRLPAHHSRQWQQLLDMTFISDCVLLHLLLGLCQFSLTSSILIRQRCGLQFRLVLCEVRLQTKTNFLAPASSSFKPDSNFRKWFSSARFAEWTTEQIKCIIMALLFNVIDFWCWEANNSFASDFIVDLNFMLMANVFRNAMTVRKHRWANHLNLELQT